MPNILGILIMQLLHTGNVNGIIWDGMFDPILLEAGIDVQRTS